MRLKIKKFIGWLLIIVGLGIIFWGLYSSYNIFFAKQEAPEIFKVKEEISTTEEKTTGPEEEAKKLIDEKLKEFFPADFGPQLFNLIAWSIFVCILILAGGKITSIGIKLIGER